LCPAKASSSANSASAAGRGQLVQELQHLVHAVRHARGERVLGVVGEIQQPRRLVAPAQDVLHHRRVVPAAGGRSLVGGARHPRLVEGAAQFAGLGIGHHRHVGRLIEVEDPAGLPALARAPLRLLHQHVVQTAQLGGVTHVPAPGVGGVQHVFLEARLQLRELEHRRLEALLAIDRQPHTGEAEVAHGVLDHPSLHRRELAPLLVGDGAVGAEQRLALRQIRLVGRQQWQAGVVAAAQAFGIEDRVQVAHRRPGARHAVVQLFQRLDECGEGGPGERRQLIDARAVLAEHLAHGGLDVLGTDLQELRQGIRIEQGILHDSRGLEAPPL
jgi:hypothetical protein